MYEYHLDNSYALKMFFNYYKNLEARDVVIFNIDEHDCKYKVEISHTRIEYFAQQNDFRYSIVLRYTNKHVHIISIYGSRYIIQEDSWHQTDDQCVFSYFDKFHNQVLSQLQNHFYTIKSKCDEIIDDFQDFNWVYCSIKSLEQNCRPKTTKYLKLYRQKIKLKQYFRKWTTYINQIILKRNFETWKEWYFDPTNKQGYVKRLKRIYE